VKNSFNEIVFHSIHIDLQALRESSSNVFVIENAHSIDSFCLLLLSLFIDNITTIHVLIRHVNVDCLVCVCILRTWIEMVSSLMMNDVRHLSVLFSLQYECYI
jgi:predicted ATPase